jgi:rhodanese-related sulfurtransferase
MMSDLLTAIAIGAAAFFVLRAFVAWRSRISGAEARALVARGAQLLDVRSEAEFGAGGLPGAENIPVQSLERRLDELDRERPIVVYCASGMRSARAADLLRGAGFDVHDLGPARAYG